MNKPINSKLPKNIAQMVEKNNLVLAIKSLAEQENISLELAKEQIDHYEQQLKQQQTKALQAINDKQQTPSLFQRLFRSKK